MLSDHKVAGFDSADGPSGTHDIPDHAVRNWRDFLTVDGERSILTITSA